MHAEEPVAQDAATPPPAIEIRELRKVYGDKAAVDGLTLTANVGCY